MKTGIPARGRELLFAVLGAAALVLAVSHRASAYPLLEKDGFKLTYGGHINHLVSSADDPFYDVILFPGPGGAVPVPVKGHSTNNTTRFRSTFRWKAGRLFSGELSVDFNYTFGSVLQSYFFKLSKETGPPAYFNWRREVIDDEGRYGTLSVYRATATMEGKNYRLIAGRQRLAYGTALFWSPVDIWNPVSPLALEPNERAGVDGFSAAFWPREDLSFTALFGLADDWDQAQAAASASFRMKSYTFDFLAGKNREDWIYGFDFVGYLGDAGVRGEFTWTAAEGGEDYPRAVLGMDNAWPNSLYLAAEFYHNGGPVDFEDFMRDPEKWLELTGVDTVNRNFLGVMAGYDLDPLVKGTLAVIWDLDKGSEAIAPSLSWLAGNHLTISGGAQFFRGAEHGEFGLYEDLGWLILRWDL